jgi:uncharacterized protein
MRSLSVADEAEGTTAEVSGQAAEGGDDLPRRAGAFTPQFVLSVPFLVMIRAYQVVLGPFMGGHCRFHPTCSEYGLEAYRKHGPLRGTWLTFWRIARCHPFGGSGFDPVP